MCLVVAVLGAWASVVTLAVGLVVGDPFFIAVGAVALGAAAVAFRVGLRKAS